ncbi:MAG: hypothetical protein D6726_12465 [Nitrospirae bacterium]|nr:MAG: hypothetical protein D6726_12465 [Nitrospirota bacterium]
MGEEKQSKETALERKIKEAVFDGRISCAVLRSIADEEGVSYREAGRKANEMKVKISDCELGCF